MALTSNTVGLQSVILAEPTWLAPVNHKQWVTPVSNWLGHSSVLDPNFNALLARQGTAADRITAWTGQGCDPYLKAVFHLANGGHNGYSGNEIIRLMLAVNSPFWERIRNATYPLPPANTGLNLVTWPDGRPTPDHTVNLTACGLDSSGRSRWLRCGAS